MRRVGNFSREGAYPTPKKPPTQPQPPPIQVTSANIEEIFAAAQTPLDLLNILKVKTSPVKKIVKRHTVDKAIESERETFVAKTDEFIDECRNVINSRTIADQIIDSEIFSELIPQSSKFQADSYFTSKILTSPSVLANYDDAANLAKQKKVELLKLSNEAANSPKKVTIAPPNSSSCSNSPSPNTSPNTGIRKTNQLIVNSCAKMSVNKSATKTPERLSHAKRLTQSQKVFKILKANADSSSDSTFSPEKATKDEFQLKPILIMSNEDCNKNSAFRNPNATNSNANCIISDLNNNDISNNNANSNNKSNNIENNVNNKDTDDNNTNDDDTNDNNSNDNYSNDYIANDNYSNDNYSNDNITNDNITNDNNTNNDTENDNANINISNNKYNININSNNTNFNNSNNKNSYDDIKDSNKNIENQDANTGTTSSISEVKPLKVHFFPNAGEVVPPNMQLFDRETAQREYQARSSQQSQLEQLQAALLQHIREQYMAERCLYARNVNPTRTAAILTSADQPKNRQKLSNASSSSGGNEIGKKPHIETARRSKSPSPQADNRRTREILSTGHRYRSPPPTKKGAKIDVKKRI